jgi:rhodanese-related sulfurtransferase
MFSVRSKKIMRLRVVFSLICFLLAGTIVAEAKSGDNRVLKDVTAEEAFDIIKSNAENPDFVVLDVRTPDEFNDGHLENAGNIDFYAGTFKDELSKLDKNRTYLIYCSTGNRSGKSLKIMKGMGFTAVYNMLGGFKGWKSKGLPFVR